MYCKSSFHHASSQNTQAAVLLWVACGRQHWYEDYSDGVGIINLHACTNMCGVSVRCSQRRRLARPRTLLHMYLMHKINKWIEAPNFGDWHCGLHIYGICMRRACECVNSHKKTPPNWWARVSFLRAHTRRQMAGSVCLCWRPHIRSHM